MKCKESVDGGSFRLLDSTDLLCNLLKTLCFETQLMLMKWKRKENYEGKRM